MGRMSRAVHPVRPDRTHGVKRRDLQGMRAIAVSIVILHHVIGVLPGGFTGVDIFFVLSGFLITGLLLKEYENTGTISASEFYRRRVRRIVPLAVVTLGVTVAVSFIFFLRNRAVEIAIDAVFAFLFVGNWRFAVTGNDAFLNAASPSPLGATWSLSVEEQFYLAWPWLMLAAIAVATRLHGSRSVLLTRTVAAGTIAVLSVASFAWAMHLSPLNSGQAYLLDAHAHVGARRGRILRVPRAARFTDAHNRPCAARVGGPRGRRRDDVRRDRSAQFSGTVGTASGALDVRDRTCRPRHGGSRV